MNVFALTHPTHGVVEWSESFEKIIRWAKIYSDCSLRYATYETLGLNSHVIPSTLVRRSDGTPCGNCDYCKQWHLRCPHGININE